MAHARTQGMIALSHSKKPTERHNCVPDLAGAFVDHNVVDRAEGLALTIVDLVPSTLLAAMRLPVSLAATAPERALL